MTTGDEPLLQLDHGEGFRVELSDARTLHYEANGERYALAADMQDLPVRLAEALGSTPARAVSRTVAGLLSLGLPVDVGVGNLDPEELTRLQLIAATPPVGRVLEALDAVAAGSTASVCFEDVALAISADGSAALTMTGLTDGGSPLRLHLDRSGIASALLAVAVAASARSVVHWAPEAAAPAFAAGAAELDVAEIGDGVARADVRWTDDLPACSLLVGAVGAAVVLRSRSATFLAVVDHLGAVPALTSAVWGDSGFETSEPSIVELVTAGGQISTAPGPLDRLDVVEWLTSEFERLASDTPGEDTAPR